MKLRHLLAPLYSLALGAFCIAANAADGMLTLKSNHDARQTMDRVEAAVKARQLTVFARIDHAGGAARIGKTLMPTELIIFGSPQGGTPLMECAQSAGIDLPLKILVWVDASGQTQLGYNDPAWLGRRHEAGACPVIENLGKALAAIAAEASAK